MQLMIHSSTCPDLILIMDMIQCVINDGSTTWWFGLIFRLIAIINTIFYSLL